MTDRLLRDLAELDPIDETAVPDGHGPEADRLLAWVLAQPHTETPRRQQRRRLWLLVPAALMLVAAGWLLAQPSERPHEVSCYREASTGADRAEAQVGADDDPVSVCARLWESGDLWAEPRPSELASCVTPARSIAVVPGDGEESCVALGWAPLDWDASAREVSLLDADLRRFHLDHACPSEEEARAHAERLLERHGLEDWDVQAVGQTTPEEPCVSIGIDSDDDRLLLTPLRAPPES